jgi:TIR domain
MSGQIFISYRREESRWSARSLHDRLCRTFEPKQIFMDIDAIALGEDFVEAIETTVAKCDVLIAVIGKNWLTTRDELGSRRLDNPEDWVRMEIGTALNRKIRLIPVLVDGALMPPSTELPEDLKLLARRNALRITDTSFDGDCQRLAATIKLVLEKAAAEEQERLATAQRQREEAETRERSGKDRLEEERCETERLEAEQRANERLEVEQREKELLDALKRQREEQERLAAEKSQREEAKERQRAQEAPGGRSVQRGRKPETQQQLERKRRRLRLIDKYSWIPFALSVLAWLCLPVSGDQFAIAAFNPVLAFFLLYLGPSLVLAVSSFFKFRFRRILEGSISAVCAVLNLFTLLVVFSFLIKGDVDPRSATGMAAYLGPELALVGAVAKVWLLIRRRELDTT